MVTFPKNFAAPSVWSVGQHLCHHQDLLEMQNLRPAADLEAVFNKIPSRFRCSLFGESVRSAVRFLNEFQHLVSDQGDLAGGLEFEAGSTSASPPGCL